MKANELTAKLRSGSLNNFANIYADTESETKRYIKAIEEFTSLYGGDRDIRLFSVPGRSEILGNHTDHENGRVLAGAIDRDIIAVVAKSESDSIHIKSEGYDECIIKLSSVNDKNAYPHFSSPALISGLCAGFINKGYSVGAFDAYLTTEVLKGSGLSSSAAFEVMIGNILNHMFCDGKVGNEEIAKISQFAENVYFGKPCGLMDQMACAVGGFVFIDFMDNANPIIEPIDFSLSGHGYTLCVVNTGGNHANLNEDYASVPTEMKSVAAYFGESVLRPLSAEKIIENASVLRKTVGDRAILRALHFFAEDARVPLAAQALKEQNTDKFLSYVLASGNSSFKYLQNVYTTKNVEEQGLSLALAITETLLDGKGCAWRVHGGGFAGTIQAFVKNEYAEDYRKVIDSVFGRGACMMLNIRPLGAAEIML